MLFGKSYKLSEIIEELHIPEELCGRWCAQIEPKEKLYLASMGSIKGQQVDEWLFWSTTSGRFFLITYTEPPHFRVRIFGDLDALKRSVPHFDQMLEEIEL